MPVSKTTKKLQRLQELAGRSQQVSVQNLRCSRGHSPWQLQFVQAAEDLCQDCVAIWQEHQHPFGAGLPTYVLLPPKPTTRLPDMPEGHSMAGQGSGAGAAAAAAGTTVRVGWMAALAWLRLRIGRISRGYGGRPFDRMNGWLFMRNGTVRSLEPPIRLAADGTAARTAA
jgi:hypothetical protein